jgi:predicted Zn-dependent protease
VLATGAVRRRGVAVVLVAGLFTFQTIDVFSPRNPQVIEMQLRRLAEAYASTGRPERALAALEEAVATCPLRCPGALADLADLYEKTGQAKDGAVYFRRFTQEYPEHPDGPRHLGQLEEAAWPR